MFSLWRIFVQNFRSRNSPVIKIIMNALSENAQKEPYPHFRALRTGEVECGSSVIDWLPCSCYGNEVMKITFVYFEKWDTEILVFLLLLVDEQFNTLELLTEKTCFNPFVSSGLPIQSHTWTNVFVSERGHQYALQCRDAVAAPRSAALNIPAMRFEHCYVYSSIKCIKLQ